jgi:hypothetical protein
MRRSCTTPAASKKCALRAAISCSRQPCHAHHAATPRTPQECQSCKAKKKNEGGKNSTKEVRAARRKLLQELL